MCAQRDTTPDAAPRTREYVAILDAGSQYGKVIDRKVRQLCVDTVILPLDTPTAQLRDDALLKGILISGGPSSVNDADAPMCAADLFDVGKPVLGICYGMQLLAKAFGGTVAKGAVREDGQEQIAVDTTSPLFRGLQANEWVLLTHGDSVTDAGAQLRRIAISPAGILAAVQHTSRPLYGVQFHPEVELTTHGLDMLTNFLRECHCAFDFAPDDREATALQLIRAQAAHADHVLCLASGGVDSTVCAVLLMKALGAERVVCVHIDHGFMRLGESAQVVAALRACGVHVHHVDAVARFANATTQIRRKSSASSTTTTTATYTSRKLCETTDPEEKRQIIGDTFMRVCDDVFSELGLRPERVLLVQGTLRPDLIESGSHYASQRADAIKTHHNDTAMVRALRDAGRILEPLRDYHKDEVRELGTRLGIARELVERQPFPGPGLAIRVLCTDGNVSAAADDDDDSCSLASTARAVAAVVAAAAAADGTTTTTTTTTSTADAHAHNGSAQATATPTAVLRDNVAHAVRAMSLHSCVLPVRTVGVQGDGRTYAYAAALSLGRSPTAAEWVTLAELARAVPKCAHAINRVVYLFGDAVDTSPRTLTPTWLTRDVLDKLRCADDVVNRILLREGLVRKLSQVPVVLLPVRFARRRASSTHDTASDNDDDNDDDDDNDRTHSIVLRTFVTSDFMTGVPALPGSALMPLSVLDELVTTLQRLPFVSRVLYDLTAKPPGTTEWE